MPLHRKAKTLLVGGTGFLGKNLIARFQHDSRPFKVVSRSVVEPEFAADTCFKADIRDGTCWDTLLSDVDTIIHLVHSTHPASSMQNISEDIISNIPPSVMLMQAAIRHGVRRLIFISSGGTVYGIPQYLPIDEDHPTDPICSYGITKLAIEKYLAMFSTLHPSLTGIILRLSNPYGPFQQTCTGQGVISHFLARVSQNLPLTIWGDGNVTRDFIHIDDVMRAITMILDTHIDSAVFNLSSGYGLTINQIVDVISSVTGKNVLTERHPGRVIDIPHVVLDPTKIKKTLQWEPKITINEGVLKLWNQINSNF